MIRVRYRRRPASCKIFPLRHGRMPHRGGAGLGFIWLTGPVPWNRGPCLVRSFPAQPEAQAGHHPASSASQELTSRSPGTARTAVGRGAPNPAVIAISVAGRALTTLAAEQATASGPKPGWHRTATNLSSSQSRPARAQPKLARNARPVSAEWASDAGRLLAWATL